MTHRFIFGVVVIAFSPIALQAADVIEMQSGTGFFVSAHGDIITNHHVVNGCKHVMVHGPISDESAKVIAYDEKNDLALVRTRERSRRFATMRHLGASHLRVGEPVLVMGFPQGSEVTGHYKIAEATVTGLTGPTEEPNWIQFSDAALPGNSGGPLLDSSGNVAGVVVGKSTLYRTVNGGASQEIVQKSDVAISLPVLMRFLEQHIVPYTTNGSYGYYMPKRLEELAQDYIVNISCPVSEN